MFRKLFLLSAFSALAAIMQAQTMSVTPGYCFNSVPGNTANAHPSFSASITSYTWSVAGPNCAGSVVATAPSGTAATLQYLCCGVQTISCTGYNGSSPVFTNTMTVNIGCPVSPAITSGSGFQVCIGGTDTLKASGAQTYTWVPGNMVGSSVVVNPSVSTCYTVSGTSSQGCSGSSAVCVTVNPAPNVSIQAPSTVCPLSALTMTATGASNYTWLPQGIVGNGTSTNFINILSGPCYTVFGSSNGCIGMATTCVSSYSMPPTLTITANTTTFCLGSSVTMTATGLLTYSWSNGSLSSTVNVLPTGPVWYMAKGFDGNGCKDSTYINLIPDTTCTIVWPGDANSDGIVNSSDVLELGLYANSSGAARSPGGNNYSGQYATAWTGNGSNSQNRAHVDCNGDGTVDAGDTLAISLNWNQSHAFKNAGSSVSGEDLTLVPATSGAGNVGWNTVDIILGSVSNNISDIYGITFDLTYDASFVDNDQVHVRYPSSFLSAGNTNIPFRRVDAGAAVINCVSVRTDGNQVSGNGKIGEFLFKHNGSKLGEMTFSASNVKMIDAGGMVTDLTGGSGTALFLHLGLEAQAGSAKIAVYPNPASGSVIFKSGNSTELSYKVADLTGRLISEGTFKGETKIDVSAFAAGTYMVSFEGEGLREVRRLIKD